VPRRHCGETRKKFARLTVLPFPKGLATKVKKGFFTWSEGKPQKKGRKEKKRRGKVAGQKRGAVGAALGAGREALGNRGVKVVGAKTA